MPSINTLIERTKDLKEEQETIEQQGKSLKEKISILNKKLENLKKYRQEINKFKEEKDELILQYIESIKQPDLLDIGFINYKALYFYFKKHFIESTNRFLSFENYSNDKTEIYKNNIFKFKEAFGEEKRIYLDIKETNFPHLIGYKTPNKTELGYYDNTLTRKFMKSIYYETNLIEDYEEHGCDLGKIKTISWILNTLEKPIYVFTQDGLKAGKSSLKTDLLFVRIYKRTYHYVSLKRIDSCKNKYVINSHHEISKSDFHKKYNKNKAIYKFDFKK